MCKDSVKEGGKRKGGRGYILKSSPFRGPWVWLRLLREGQF